MSSKRVLTPSKTKHGKGLSKWKASGTIMRPALEEAMVWLEPASEDVLETLGGGKHTLWYLP